MNATEQKQRFTAVSRVEKRCDDVETVCAALNDTVASGLTALDAKVCDVAKTAVAAIDDVMQAMSDETEHRVALGAIVRGHQAFVQRTFWQRLRWLLRGV